MKTRKEVQQEGDRIHTLTLASLDGNIWGVINCKTQYRGPQSAVGSEWEVAIKGEDEYCQTVAQTWYESWKEAIEDQRVDGPRWATA
ncbi:MAG: hypothetical protein ACRC8Y_02005 [Chroococcales cyanobacterium]